MLCPAVSLVPYNTDSFPYTLALHTGLGRQSDYRRRSTGICARGCSPIIPGELRFYRTSDSQARAAALQIGSE